MAKAIVEFEARRDAKGRLAVYALPAGDGGGRYEVAGINDRYHKAEVDHVVALIEAAGMTRPRLLSWSLSPNTPMS